MKKLIVMQAEGIIGENKRFDDENTTNRLNSIVIHYGEICRQNCPALTEAEWSTILQVHNYPYLFTEAPNFDPTNRMLSALLEMDELENVGKRFGVDVEDLASRICDLPYVEKIAIVEVITRYWSFSGVIGHSMSDHLEKCGAKILKSK